MRITTRVVSANGCWYPQWPTIDFESCFEKQTDGTSTFVESEFRRQASGIRQIQIGAEDKGMPLAFSAILIQSVNDWLNNVRKNPNDERTQKVRDRLDRRLERGVVTFVRVDIHGIVVDHKGKKVRGSRVRITSDDKGVVEDKKYERYFAMVIADFCNCYSKRYVARGEPALEFSTETVELLNELDNKTDEANRICEIKELNANRFLCKNYCKGLCSPFNPNCRNYKDGRCVELEVKQLWY